ncbi:MAG: virulence factor BrkB family protein [Sedimenticola sp.]
MHVNVDEWRNRLPMPLLRVGRFIKLLVSRFIEDQGLPNAASLTFTTLLSLVPLMTVSLAIFAAFPVSDRVEEQIQGFLFENFVPTSSEVLEEYLRQFSAKASRLSGASFIFLVVVALMLMANIDRAFNTIWQVKRKRGPLSMFMVYWAILSLGPILMGASVALTSYLVSIPLLSDAAETLEVGSLLGLTPMFASVVAFTLLYALVPNRRVSLKHALAGGVLAALLFESAKRGFAFYITSFPTYEAIYGALAVVPIFLVWIYLTWVITLVGAEFAHCLGIYRDEDFQGSRRRGSEMLLAYRVMNDLWRAQKGGRALTLTRLSKLQGHYPEEKLEHLLIELQEARLVLRTDNGRWALARDLSDVPLMELYMACHFVLPDEEAIPDEAGDGEMALAEVLARVRGDMGESMSIPLEQLYSRQDQP